MVVLDQEDVQTHHEKGMPGMPVDEQKKSTTFPYLQLQPTYLLASPMMT